MIKACKNMSYKRKRSFKRFWKNIEEKRKKNPILLYPGLRYTHKKNKICMQSFFIFEHENQFAVEKKNKKKCLGAISKTLLWKLYD